MDFISVFVVLLILIPFIVVAYNIIRTILIISPSLNHLLLTDSLHLVKGYNSSKIILTIGITMSSVAILWKYNDLLFQNNRSLNLELIVLIILIVCSIFLIEKKQPYSFFKTLKLNFQKSDILDFDNSYYFQNDKVCMVNPYIRVSNKNEMKSIIDSQVDIEIDQLNQNRLFELLNKGKISENVIIQVKPHGEGQIQKKPTILFLNKILHLEELWNSNKYTHVEILNFINENFNLECEGIFFKIEDINISTYFSKKNTLKNY